VPAVRAGQRPALARATCTRSFATRFASWSSLKLNSASPNASYCSPAPQPRIQHSNGTWGPLFRLADVGHFAKRFATKLLLIVDIADGGVELVVAEQELNLFERSFGVVVDAGTGPAGVMGGEVGISDLGRIVADDLPDRRFVEPVPQTLPFLRIARKMRPQVRYSATSANGVQVALACPIRRVWMPFSVVLAHCGSTGCRWRCRNVAKMGVPQLTTPNHVAKNSGKGFYLAISSLAIHFGDDPSTA
jgi:hypothetical protein